MKHFRRLLPCVLLALSLITVAVCRAEVFNLAVVPDTQLEIMSDADTRLANRMQWLTDQKEKLNLKMVLHVGDQANWNRPDHAHFIRSSAGFEILDKAQIPFAIAVGNHDTAAVREDAGSAAPGNVNANLRTTTVVNSFYPTKRFLNLKGTFEEGKIDNAWHEFTAGGLNWLVINLELWPRTEVVAWAKTVVQDHPHHNVILLTHSFLNSKSAIEPTNGGYGNNSPQYVFEQLLKPYDNVRLVFSGHVGNHGYHTDTGTSGNTIHEFVQCFHDKTTNPVRLIEIDTEKGTIRSRVYSPATEESKADAAFSVKDVQWVAAR